MRLKWLILLFSFFFVLVCCKPKHLKQVTPPDSLLWEVSGNGLPEASYIYGSIHYIPVADAQPTTNIEEHIQHCKTLYLEANPNELDSVFRTIPDTIFFLPQNTTYREYLAPNDYLDFYIFLRDSLKLPSQVLKKALRLKPMFADRFITGAYFGKMFSYEKYFQKLAKTHNLPIKGLDSGDEIVAYIPKFNALQKPEDFWVTKDSSKTKMLRGYIKIVEMYKKNIGYRLDSLMKCDQDFEIDTVIMRERNSKWLPQMVVAMRQNPSFIVVGARHLGGKDGIIRRLKNLNYKLMPV